MERIVDISYTPLMVLGIFLIVLGVIALMIPFLFGTGVLRRIEQLPPLLVYVYHSDGFYFVTSPILIVVSILYFLFRWRS